MCDTTVIFYFKILQTWIQFGTTNYLSAENPCHTHPTPKFWPTPLHLSYIYIPPSPLFGDNKRTHITRKLENMAAVAGASSSVIKVAALSGSLRKGSYNRALIRSGRFLLHTLRQSHFYFSILLFIYLFVCFDFNLFWVDFDIDSYWAKPR